MSTDIEILETGYEIPSSLYGEIDHLESLINRFRNGEINEAELKAHRVPFGVYEQRTKGLFMVRVRCAAGIITPAQLKGVGSLANQYGSGRLHITTRQEVQIHDIALINIVPVIRGLLEFKLASRGGGGNTVRNITASWDSGIAPEEEFDVTPHAVALTSKMISISGSWLLPRKFKIAFSNSAVDNAYATVNDVGFVATIRDGVRGFKVFVAGGMGRMPQAGELLHDFISEDKIFEVAEAVKRVFSEFGNRRNKHTARLRFLYNSLGRARFIDLYETKRREIRDENQGEFSIITRPQFLPQEVSLKAQIVQDDSFKLWRSRYAIAQSQSGLFAVRLPLTLGDLSGGQAIELAGELEAFGDDTIRFTNDQNVALRNIPEAFLGNIYHLAVRLFPQHTLPPVLSGAVACAGASTCQLGICLSRGALLATVERLWKSGLNLDTLGKFRLHFSGCANSCGQHGLAHLGFSGKVGRKGDDVYPAYSVVAGAMINSDGETKLAQRIGDVAARDVPQFIEEFLSHYILNFNKYSSYHQYLDYEGISQLRILCDKYSLVPEKNRNDLYYVDWGAREQFSLQGRGTGECATGLFDLIDLEIARMREARKLLIDEGNEAGETVIYDAIVHAAKALLITQGAEAAGDLHALQLFERFFISTNIISERFRGLVSVASGGLEHCASLNHEDVIALCDKIESLYSSMDETLKFHTPSDTKVSDAERVDMEKDLRGVVCPMNFVKTKLALSQLGTGQVLKVLIDNGEPAENVPLSLKAEGHEIIRQQKENGFWSIIIKKVR